MNYLSEVCEVFNKEKVLNGFQRNTTDLIIGVFSNSVANGITIIKKFQTYSHLFYFCAN